MMSQAQALTFSMGGCHESAFDVTEPCDIPVTSGRSIIEKAVQNAVVVARDMQLVLDKLCEHSLSLRQQLDAAVATVASIDHDVRANHENIGVPGASSDASATCDVPNEGQVMVMQQLNVVSDRLQMQPIVPVCSTNSAVKNLSSQLSFGRVRHAASDRSSDGVVHEDTVSLGTSSKVSEIADHGTRGRGLPPGKRYHYFLSHKKHHSTMGDACEHVARGLHDALEAAGYVGFFDIDNLEEIDRESIVQAVKRSCLMLVVMSDETVHSEWCCLEWVTAEANNVEIKCIVDLQRFNKRAVIASVKETYPMVLKHQWTDYSDRLRRTCFVEIDCWIQKKIKRNSVISHQVSGTSLITVVDPIFALLLLVTGMPLRHDHETAFFRRMWALIVQMLTFVCLGLCLARFILAEGPAHLDRVSTFYLVLIHVVVLYCSCVASSHLADQINAILTLYGDSDGCIIVQRRLRRNTRIVGMLSFIGGAVVSVFALVAHIPLFLDSFYTGSESYLFLFGWPQSIIYAFVAPVTLMQAVVFLTKLYIANALSVGVFATAFDELDPKIAFMGIDAFAASGNMNVTPGVGSVNIFRNIWLRASRSYFDIQARTTVCWLLHYLVHGWGLMVPCSFHFFDNPLGPSQPIQHLLQIIGWWIFAASVYSAAVIMPFAAGRTANDLRAICRSLHFSSGQENVLTSSLLASDLTWRIGPFHVGEAMLAILMLPVIFSGGILISVIWENYSS